MMIVTVNGKGADGKPFGYTVEHCDSIRHAYERAERALWQDRKTMISEYHAFESLADGQPAAGGASERKEIAR